MTIVQRLLLSCCVLLCVAWTDSLRSQVVEGNRLFSEGSFGGAVESYGQALVDQPDSPLLNFNMGTAHYKAGAYTQALTSFSRVQARPEDSAAEAGRAARTAYNMGNTQYQMGAQAEEQNPQAALAAYTNALASYRRALGADPTDQDAKFNYEFVAKRIEELQDKLEQQPQPEADDRQQQQERQDQQPDGEHTQDSARAEQERHTGQDQADEMSENEAQSVIDTARNEELSPDEFARQAQRGSMTEPLRDW